MSIPKADNLVSRESVPGERIVFVASFSPSRARPRKTRTFGVAGERGQGYGHRHTQGQGQGQEQVSLAVCSVHDHASDQGAEECSLDEMCLALTGDATCTDPRISDRVSQVEGPR